MGWRGGRGRGAHSRRRADGSVGERNEFPPPWIEYAHRRRWFSWPNIAGRFQAIETGYDNCLTVAAIRSQLKRGRENLAQVEQVHAIACLHEMSRTVRFPFDSFFRSRVSNNTGFYVRIKLQRCTRSLVILS